MDTLCPGLVSDSLKALAGRTSLHPSPVLLTESSRMDSL